ncbi:MAG: bifunctional alpha,alpha-trehalose-phosphate synthase (UDP-forming)/trehalose-phosphatase [Catenulispora sp.]
MTHAEDSRGSSALVVVANRLPVDLVEPDTDGGEREWRRSPGGLVTALEPTLRARGGTWVGWPGLADAEPEPFDDEGMGIHPVPITADELAAYYEGFSNATLWPLYHDVVATPRFQRSWWEAYRRVNERFAEAAAQVASQGATVWVQDYQLQLVPRLLRERRPDLRIGFFLHIPFPPVELFMQLPWRTEVVRGLLGADVIGFQLPGGAQNFLWLTRRLLGLEPTKAAVRVRSRPGSVPFEGRHVRVGAFPIAIDAAAFDGLSRRADTTERARQMRSEMGDPQRLLLGVDRLDYTKGIDVRLRALGELLAAGRVDPETVAMVQLATPSRERVDQYQAMRRSIEEQVGRLNGQFGRVGRPIVHYLHQSMDRDELVAMYCAADVMVVTPLRDGMNLVCKEYVATRHGLDGVLVLSEFAGAAAELTGGALLVNPYDLDGVTQTLERALTMDPVEERARMRTLHRQVMTHDVVRWAQSFLDFLDPAQSLTGRVLGEAPVLVGSLPTSLRQAVDRLARTPRLLVVCDYDGTLAPIVADPARAMPRPESVQAMRSLAALPETTAGVISGRALPDLAALSRLPAGVHLIGSHGAEFDAGFAQALDGEAQALRRRLETDLELLVARRRGVFLEPKTASIAVHVRRAEPGVGESVLEAVRSGPAQWQGVHVTEGKSVIELAVIETNKGEALDMLRRQSGATAALFVGDDITDEKAFARLTGQDVGVKVGDGESLAEFSLPDTEDVAAMLAYLLAERRAWLAGEIR